VISGGGFSGSRRCSAIGPCGAAGPAAQAASAPHSRAASARRRKKRQFICGNFIRILILGSQGEWIAGGAQLRVCLGGKCVDVVSEQSVVEVEGRVKWYDAIRGYGFVISDGVEGDILAHANCVRASGRTTLPEGATIRLEAALFERGWQAVQILEVGEGTEQGFAERPSEFAGAALAEGPLLPARVKWFDRGKGFGFLNIFGKNEDVFVHMEVLRRTGIADMAPGEAVAVRTMVGPRGLMAAEVRPWETAATESDEDEGSGDALDPSA